MQSEQDAREIAKLSPDSVVALVFGSRQGGLTPSGAYGVPEKLIGQWNAETCRWSLSELGLRLASHLQRKSPS